MSTRFYGHSLVVSQAPIELTRVNWGSSVTAASNTVAQPVFHTTATTHGVDTLVFISVVLLYKCKC